MAPISLNDPTITALGPANGVMVRAVVNPNITGSGALSVVNGSLSTRMINDQIDGSYIVDGDTAYWTLFILTSEGDISLNLGETASDVSNNNIGPQFTPTALANLGIILFYGSSSAKWRGDLLDDSDSTDPFNWNSASVNNAGTQNTNFLRN